jgi:hypothetical protein
MKKTRRDVPTVSTKNLPSTEVRVRKISKLKNPAKLRSILGDSAEDIQQLLEKGDSDSATTLLHKRLLQTLVDLVPCAEANVRKTKGARGVYQINSLISSIREVMIDIQNLSDKGALGEALVEKIIRPSFLDIGMRIVESYSSVAMDAKTSMSPEEFRGFKEKLAENRKNIAEYIQNEYGRVRTECKTFLQK